jgi:hypothetical protein
MDVALLTSAILRGALTAAKTLTVEYVSGVSFSAVARALSLLLAFSALVLSFVFIGVSQQKAGCRSARV